MTNRKVSPGWNKCPRHELWMWERIVVVDSCWEWIGEMGAFGYGYVRQRASRRRKFAHRAMYEMLRGPIPDGMDMDHLCRNRRCVNPDHLEPVTHRENCRRGNGYSGRNARKTHCPAGHPYATTPLVQWPSKPPGGRWCLICERARATVKNAARSAAKKAAK